MFSFHLFIGLNKQTVVFSTTCEISGVGGGLNYDEDVIMRARARARLCVGVCVRACVCIRNEFANSVRLFLFSFSLQEEIRIILLEIRIILLETQTEL